MRLGLLLFAISSVLPAQTGGFTIHLILHAIGEERYEIKPSGGGILLDTTC